MGPVESVFLPPQGDLGRVPVSSDASATSEPLLNREAYASGSASITDVYCLGAELPAAARATRVGCVTRAATHLSSKAQRLVEIYPKSTALQQLAQLREEVHILQMVTSRASSTQAPFVLHLHECFEDQFSLFIVLERPMGLSMFDFLAGGGKFQTHEILSIAKQVTYALECLHLQFIAHSHINLHSVQFVASKSLHIKLMDFQYVTYLCVCVCV